MKVLFVQNIEGIAGSEKYFWQLLPALKSKNIEVEFLAVFKPNFSSVVTEFEKVLTQHDIKTHQISTKSYLSYGLLRKMKKLILKNKFDIIHSHLIYADFWSASLRTFFGLKTTLVSTLHGYQEDIYTKYCTEPKKTPHNNYFRVAKFAYKRIDHVYSCSDGLKNFFLAAGIKFKNNVSVIYHGFDYKNLSDTLREDKDFICSIPGRLIPRKGHYFVLNQCKKLIEAIPHFKLQIIGDGPLRKELEEFVAQNNLSHVVKFTGNVPSVLPLLQNSDLVLIPSYAEGLPLVIFEAMSVSKPVIAFNTIGPAEAVLDGKTGYLIEPFDSDLFAEKIIFLSKNTSLLIDMGLAGKKYLESTFTLEIMVANTISFYQTCLNDRPLLTT